VECPQYSIRLEALGKIVCIIFLEKITPYGKISKILFRKSSLPHWSTVVFKFREIWPTGNW